MKKLTPEDIKIISPGKQAKKAIKEKYHSIENFAKVIDMGNTTIYQYLKRTDLGSDKFKVKLVNAFDAGLDEIVLSEENQIKRFVDEIFYNFHNYNTKEDLITFKKVVDLCKEEHLQSELLKMERNKAMYYSNIKRTDQAIEILEELIEKTYRLKYYYHWIFFNGDLSLLYGYSANPKKALQIHEGIQLEGFERVNDMNFKEPALYRHYYHYGVICNRLGHYDKAKALFEESLSYIKNDIDKGVSIVGIGLTYKKKGEYDKALEYYFKALDIQPSVEKKIKIFNNIAEVYKQKEDYETAMKYIIKAKHWIKWFDIKTNYSVYVTYLEIKFLIGESEIALRELMSWSLSEKKKNIPKSHIIAVLKSIIMVAVKINSFDTLVEIEGLIIEIIRQSNEKPYIEELRSCLGRITEIFYENTNRRRVFVEK